MSARPTVRRTYGRPRLAPASSASLLFDSSSPPRSSSPPSSTYLATPRQSSPTPVHVAGEDAPLDGCSSPSAPKTTTRQLFDDVAKVSVTDQPLAKAAQPTQSSLMSFFSSAPKKRPLAERSTIPPALPAKRPLPQASSSKHKQGGLTQMHLTHLPLLHSCKECAMSYVRGGEDEGTHAKHHAKVVRGIPWEGLGKGKGKGKAKDDGWRVVADNVEFGSGREKGKGRIIVCDGSWGGPKLGDILSTVDTVLSSPPLSDPILDRCKVFIFVTSSPPPTPKRQKLVPMPNAKRKNAVERIVSVVVAQPIKTALRVLRESEDGGGAIDSGGGVMCDPEPLETPLGIHRLFTIPSYRSLSLAKHLLDASCRHTVYGCVFDPLQDQVAFSQPTQSGRATMERWGKGHVRVFIDDERQL